MNARTLLSVASATSVLLLAGTAYAHEGHGGHGAATFSHGLAHPFTGLDHLLAMVAVGLMAVRLGSHWRWVLPLGFVGGLAIGGVLGALHVGIPGVEMSIALSVLLFGVLLSLGKAVSPWVFLAIVGVAAFPHGYAHLTEAGTGSVLGYGIGMVLGSALLHAGGLLTGMAIAQTKATRERWQWVAGPALACAGLALTVMVAIGN